MQESPSDAVCPRTFKRRFQIAVGIWLVFPGAHVPADSIQPALPADVTMNKDAGRGSFLFVTVRLQDGKKLPFILDTGMYDTCIDKSLKSGLGKRLTSTKYYLPGSTQKSEIYAAPKLYLGDVPLTTDDFIATLNLKWLSKESHRSIMGILGFDCLKHYCIQMDFQAGKLRFLDDKHLNAPELGEAFQLRDDSLTGNPLARNTGFFEETDSDVEFDTGCAIDGLLNRDLFRQEFRNHQKDQSDVCIPECIWNGQRYTNLYFGTVSNIPKNMNMIGLRFMARHLVTLDFPNHIMYLKQTSVGALN